jgi:hypothetical protein
MEIPTPFDEDDKFSPALFKFEDPRYSKQTIYRNAVEKEGVIVVYSFKPDEKSEPGILYYIPSHKRILVNYKSLIDETWGFYEATCSIIENSYSYSKDEDLRKQIDKFIEENGIEWAKPNINCRF